MSIAQAEHRFTQYQTYFLEIDINSNSEIDIPHYYHSTAHNCNFIKPLEWYVSLRNVNTYPYNLTVTLFTSYVMCKSSSLTHWGRVTHICVGKLTIIDSDNGLSPERRQANIWTNAGMLLIGPLGTNFSEILIEIQTFSLKKIRSKMSSVKWCSFRLGLNELNAK